MLTIPRHSRSKDQGQSCSLAGFVLQDCETMIIALLAMGTTIRSN